MTSEKEFMMLEKPGYEDLEKRIQELEAYAQRHELIKEKLQASEERFRCFIESATECFSLWDSKLNLIDCNEAGINLFSYPELKKNIIGKNIVEIAPGIEQTEIYNKYLKVIKSGEPLFLGDVVPHPNFGERYLNIKGFKVDSGLGMIVEDITKSKQAEDALRESEEKYRNLVELSPDPIIIIQDDRYRFINSAFIKLLGYSQKEVDNGLSFYNLVQESDKKTVSLRYKDRLAEEPVGRKFEIDLVSKKGKCISVESSGIKITYDGRPAFMTILRDIRERKQAAELLKKAHDELEERVKERTSALSELNARLNTEIDERKCFEEELKKSEKKYRDLVETVNDVIWEVDTEGRYTYLSPRIEDILGYEGKELLGKPFTDQMTSDEAYRVSDIFRKFVTEPAPFTALETMPTRKDGSTAVIENSGKPFFSVDGELLGFRGVYRDITERKQAEGLVRNLTHKLIRSQDNERQIISQELHDTVAQDLSSSRISLQMLLEEKSLTPAIRKKISELSETLKTTLKTVRDLSYDLRPPGLKRFGLTKTIYKHCNAIAKDHGLMLNFSSAGIDNVKLNDYIKINIYRLVQEGLNNVKKHAEASCVNIKLVSSFPDIIIRIEDDGKGFDVNQCLSEADDEKHMGLSNMQERVRLLQGTISIKSIPDKGTMILIKIPYPDENTGENKGHIVHK